MRWFWFLVLTVGSVCGGGFFDFGEECNEQDLYYENSASLVITPAGVEVTGTDVNAAALGYGQTTASKVVSGVYCGSKGVGQRPCVNVQAFIQQKPVGGVYWLDLSGLLPNQYLAALNGRKGGERLQFQYATGWQYFRDYDNCGGDWFSEQFGALFGEEPDSKGKEYVRTVWNIVVDTVANNRTDPTSVVLNSVDVAARLDSDARVLSSRHYHGAVTDLSGAPLSFFLRGTVVDFGDSDLAVGTAPIVLYIVPPNGPKVLRPGSLMSVVPVN